MPLDDDYQKKTYDEVIALKDLFLRRLMDDKVKTSALVQMKEENEALHRMLDEKAILSLVKEIILVCDRIESQGEVDELTSSVCEELIEILERRDIYKITRTNTFDPICHNAVGTEEATDDSPDKSIVKYIRDGYVFRDKVLRPADVIVSVNRRSRGTED